MPGGPELTPLRIDVADLLTQPGSRRPVALAARVGDLGSAGGVVADREPVTLDLALERIADGIVVRGEVTAWFHGMCGRCLAEIDDRLTVTVSELFDPDPIDSETYPLVGHLIDLEQLVRDVVLLALPTNPVCVGACAEPRPEMAEDPEPDPRWAALSQLEL